MWLIQVGSPSKIYFAHDGLLMHWLQVIQQWFSRFKWRHLGRQTGIAAVNFKKVTAHLSLGSSMSVDNRDSGRSSSTSAGSTDSSKCSGEWWEGEHPGWLTGLSASLENVRTIIFTFSSKGPCATTTTDETYGTRWAWFLCRNRLTCRRQHRWSRNKLHYPTTSLQWWPGQPLLGHHVT